jgi:CBS domain-containing protein
MFAQQVYKIIYRDLHMWITMKTLRVRDLMNTQVITVKPTDTLRQAIIKLAVDNVTGAPVVDNRNHVVGFISENDVLKLILEYQDLLTDGIESHNLLSVPMDGEITDDKVAEANRAISETKVGDIMARNVLYTTTDAEIVESLKVMMKLNVNRLPVLEQGVLVGTLSRSDIIFFIYKKKV